MLLAVTLCIYPENKRRNVTESTAKVNKGCQHIHHVYLCALECLRGGLEAFNRMLNRTSKCTGVHGNIQSSSRAGSEKELC